MFRCQRLVTLCFGFLALACNITEPCVIETRYVAQYDRWRVVCLAPQNGAQLCMVWPAGASDWLGDVKQMPLHGVNLTAITVCRDVPITDTPRLWPHNSAASGQRGRP